MIGGDHTVAYPLLKAMYEKHGPIAVLHADAHLDTWDTYFGAPITHGTPFRRASEDGFIDLTASAHLGIRGPLYGKGTWRTTPRSASRSPPPSSSRSTGSTRPWSGCGLDSGTGRCTSRSTSTCWTPPTPPAQGPRSRRHDQPRAAADHPRPRGPQHRGRRRRRGLPAYDHAQLTAVAASHVVYELVSAMGRPAHTALPQQRPPHPKARTHERPG